VETVHEFQQKKKPIPYAGRGWVFVEENTA
jgi:hypothetical protein